MGRLRIPAILGIAGASFALVLTLALVSSGTAFAQTAPSEDPTESQIDAALEDLSELYGSPVVRIDQAKAICNQELYFVDCAEIGKRHGLFTDERVEQIDAILTEIKGQVVQDLKQCGSIECLVDVASSIAGRFSAANPTIAREVELTPKNIEEKRIIIDTANEIGVDIEACRTMDPDTASVDLLRSCARLAQHKDIQQYIPEDVRDRAENNEDAIALKESLQSGELQCGDGTLDGCGNFCLNPSSEAREQGVSSIPPICLQIATRFFGEEGAEELKRAYSDVQQTFDNIVKRGKDVLFTTVDGRTLTNLQDIGRYMEESGRIGDVEAVERGMDFLVSKGFVSPADRDFALKMVGNIQDRGLDDFDFDQCRSNPGQCEDFIPEDHRGEFAVMGQVDRIMRTELESRGVSDPSQCEFDRSLGEACMEAARAAIPQLERLVDGAPQISFMIQDLRQKIRFGEEGLHARERAEERFREEDGFVVDGKRFRSMVEFEQFCSSDPGTCLAEAARVGVFSRDIAAEKYQYAAEFQFKKTQDIYYDDYRDDTNDPYYSDDRSYLEFDRDEALRKFEQWLDNPEGAPPIPQGMNTRPYDPYQPYQDPNYDSPYYQDDHDQPYYPGCRDVAPRPCSIGEYRQESRNELGCYTYGACIPIDTDTGPKPIDGRIMCPAIVSIDSCPSGQEKYVTYSSPECGTFYACRTIQEPTGVVFPYTFSSGKVVRTYDEAFGYCDRLSVTNNDIASECAKEFSFEYPGVQPVTDCAKYGSGWHSVDQSGNCFNPNATEYRTPGGTLQQCSRASVWGCNPIDYKPSEDQIEQLWNNLGLRSWIRNDADPARIGSLKQACANVETGFSSGYPSDVWTPGAGNPTSPDFGMPDPEKCRKAASCEPGQYFDGSECLFDPLYDPPQFGDCSNNTSPNACYEQSDCFWNGDSATGQCEFDYGFPEPVVDGCGYFSSYAMCSSEPTCKWSTSYNGAGYCEDADQEPPQTFPGDENSCPGFAYSKWDNTGVRYCQLNNVTSCLYDYPQYLDESNYSPASCPQEDLETAVSGMCSEELLGLLGSGCHSMGNAWFNGEMTEYVFPGTETVRSCSINSVPGCSDVELPPPPEPVVEQKTQVWSFYGLTSQIRGGAEQGRVEYLKKECELVSSSSDVWMSGAGNPSSPDFGMPDPEKCRKAAKCTSSQYFNGSYCTGTQPTTQPTIQTPTIDTSSMARCFYPNVTKDGQSVGWTIWCEADYVNCHYGDPAGDVFDTTGASLGAPSSCESGWDSGGTETSTGSGSDYGTCGNSTSQSSCTSISNCSWYEDGSSSYCYYDSSYGSTCSSDQYWDSRTNSCQSVQTACAEAGGTWSSSSNFCDMPNTTNYSSDPATGCTQAGGTWNSSSNFCDMPGSTSCGSDQYWDGGACVNNPSTSCGQYEYWDGSTCVYAAPSCSSDQYWDGNTCVTSSPPPAEEPPTASEEPVALFCPQGHSWNGSYCTLAVQSDLERYTANVLAAFGAIFSFLGF